MQAVFGGMALTLDYRSCRFNAVQNATISRIQTTISFRFNRARYFEVSATSSATR